MTEAPQVDRRAQLELAHSQLSDEHRTIMALVGRLKRNAHDAELEPLLEELHKNLVNHFAHEQFPGGLYESMGAYGSAYHNDLRVLIGEHCTILSAVRGLLEKVRLCGARTQPGLHEDVADVVAWLEAHEHKEHKLADKLLHGAPGSVGADA